MIHYNSKGAGETLLQCLFCLPFLKLQLPPRIKLQKEKRI